MILFSMACPVRQSGQWFSAGREFRGMVWFENARGPFAGRCGRFRAIGWQRCRRYLSIYRMVCVLWVAHGRAGVCEKNGSVVARWVRPTKDVWGANVCRAVLAALLRGMFAGKKGGVHRKSRALWLNEARVRAYVFICRASACLFLSLVNSYRSTTELTRHVRTACGGRWRGRVRDTASEWVRAGAGGLAARQFVQPTAARWHHFEPPTRQKKWQKKTNRSLSTNYSCFPRLQSIVIDQSSFAPNVNEGLQAQQPTGGRPRICPRSHHPSPRRRLRNVR